MNYSFNCEIAKEVGVDGSVMLENIYYWISKNRANKKHFYDGNYWTYNSVQAFEELFPFWSSRQISRILKNLELKGLIITGNYNKLAYDRTKWYALTKIAYSIYPNGEMELPKPSNGIDQTVEPIPNINTNINTDINIIKKKETEFDILIREYTNNITLKNNLYEFIKMRKGIKAAITTLGLKKLLNELDKLSSSDEQKIKILDNSIMNSWKGIFPIKKENKSNNYKNEKALKFNNFEGREYDYDSLEKKLLGWGNDEE